MKEAGTLLISQMLCTKTLTASIRKPLRCNHFLLCLLFQPGIPGRRPHSASLQLPSLSLLYASPSTYGLWSKKAHPLGYQFDQKPSSPQVVLGYSFPDLCIYLIFLLNFQISAPTSLLEARHCLLSLHWGFHYEITSTPHLPRLASTALCCHCGCLLPSAVTLSF